MLRRIIKRIWNEAVAIVRQETEWVETRRFLRKRAFRWAR